jgi:uncharacterized protein (TIGR03437 family)
MRFVLIACLLLGSFSVISWSQTPSVQAVVNNYSNIVPGLPNYGIAQGSIFAVYGRDFAVGTSTLQSAPLKSSVNGVSISVTVNGTVTTPLIYFVSPTQIDALLPSATPVGAGTITVTNNGSTSAPAPIQVVAGAFGILTVNSAGTGMAAALDAANHLVGVTSAVNPGEVIVLWGTGLGPVAGDESVAPPQTDMTTPISVTIGGAPAVVQYHGRSQYPGLDQINAVVPAGISGCAVSVVVQTGTYTSNFATLPVAAAGRTCTDPEIDLTPAQLESVISKGTYNLGLITLNTTATTGPSGVKEGGIIVPGTTTTVETGNASFVKISVPPAFDFSALDQAVSLGSCVVYSGAGPNPSVYTGITSTPLNAGAAVTVTSGANSQPMTYANGQYNATFPVNFLGPGAYVIDNGSGGPDVGPFSYQVTVPAPLFWVNLNAYNALVRSSGVTVNWTGGDPGSLVSITGLSLNNGSGSGPAVWGYFTCSAPVSAGTFTVPGSILLALPLSTLIEGESSSILSVINSATAPPSTTPITGIDYTFVRTIFDFSKIVVYQ